MRSWPWWWVVAVGCPAPGAELLVDNDGDGASEVDGDCDDTKGAIGPNSPEVCNEVDDNCDGQVDEPEAIEVIDRWCLDVDDDQQAGPDCVSSCVDPGDGQIWRQVDDYDQTDCDDDDPDVYFGAPERCDSKDNDCDEAVDDADPDRIGGEDFRADDDGDGHAAGGLVKRCAGGDGFLDGSAPDDDCDDDDDAINPDAREVCNTLDDDCDTFTDDEDPDAVFTGADGAVQYWADEDEDLFGDPATSRYRCGPDAGLVTNGTDCDDGAPTINPATNEVCDDVDSNCDPLDEPYLQWAEDGDGDGFGNGNQAVTDACSSPGASWLLYDPYDPAPWDCNDGAADVFPGAVEDCDGVDTNCDNLGEEGAVDAVEWHPDTDLDGYGYPDAWSTQCSPPTVGAWVADATDCDDTSDLVNPGERERCVPVGVDDDCDGFADAADPDAVFDPATGGTLFYGDNDNDGVGNALEFVYLCEQPIYYADVAGDCDDLNQYVQDPPTDYWPDLDGDGYGDDTGAPGISLTCAAPPGNAQNPLDCDDRPVLGAGLPRSLDDCRTPSIDETCGGWGREVSCDPSLTAVAFPVALPSQITGGQRVTAHGDLDGDGLDDAVVGTFNSPETLDDQLTIFFQATAPDPWPVATITAERVTNVYGPTNRGSLWGIGAHFRNTTDTDLIVVDHNGADDADGALWIVDGPIAPADLTLLAVDAIPFDNLTSGNRGGYAAAVGDLLNDDGLDEVIITAPNFDGVAGGTDQVFVLVGGTSPTSTSHPDVIKLVNIDEYIDNLGVGVAFTDALASGEPGIALVSGGYGLDGVEVVVLPASQLDQDGALPGTPYAWFETTDVNSIRPGAVTFADLDGDGDHTDLLFGSADGDVLPQSSTIYLFRDVQAGAGGPERADYVADTILEFSDRSCATALSVVGTTLVVACPDASNTQGQVLTIELDGLFGRHQVDAALSDQHIATSGSANYPGSFGMTVCDVAGVETALISYADRDYAMARFVP